MKVLIFYFFGIFFSFEFFILFGNSVVVVVRRVNWLGGRVLSLVLGLLLMVVIVVCSGLWFLVLVVILVLMGVKLMNYDLKMVCVMVLRVWLMWWLMLIFVLSDCRVFVMDFLLEFSLGILIFFRIGIWMLLMVEFVFLF